MRRPTARRVPQVKALTPYQTAIVTSPWFGADGKAITHTFEKSRRIGGSEAGALRALMWALGREMQPDGTAIPREPMDVNVTSKDFTSAKDVVKKIAANCLEMGQAGDQECAQADPRETKIYFPSTGTTVRALASTGTSIRSNTGAMFIDEFPFVRNQEEVWAAASIVAKPTLGNAHGYPVLVVGTPWEAGSFAHRIFTDPDFPFERFSVDIYKAVEQGFPIDPEKARIELGIPELFETEYLCMWSRGGGSFFPADKLRLCCEDDYGDERGNTRSGLPVGWQQFPRFYGVDVGGGPGVSGVGRDFTAIVQWCIIDGEYWITGVRAFNHLETEAQADALANWVMRYPGEVKVDRGLGGGAAMINLLRSRLAGRRIEVNGANMSRNDQEKFAGKFKALLSGRQLKIYLGEDAGGDKDGARALMLELSRIKAKMGGGGHIVLETPRDPLRGHCDRAWACLIGLSAQSAGAFVMNGGGSAGYRPAAVHEVDFDHRGIG